jgi:hypothetical protein
MLNNWSVYLDCAIAGAKSIRPLGAEFGEDEDDEKRTLEVAKRLTRDMWQYFDEAQPKKQKARCKSLK